MSNLIREILTLPALLQTRRNHGLEHATIHILNERFPHTTFIGRSDHRGFFLYGQVSTEVMQQAVYEALERLRAGEHTLAIHPHCGTNLVTSGIFAGTASFISMIGSKEKGWRERLERLPLAVALATLALIVAQPLGRTIQQRLTTEPDPGSMEIASVHLLVSGPVNVHRILTVC